MEKVDILLSVYKPDREYLIKQLNSLNNQDYENLVLLMMIVQNALVTKQSSKNV